MRTNILTALVSSFLLQPADADFPSAFVFTVSGGIHGLSEVHDYLTEHHHVAYVDTAAGKVMYKLIRADGTTLDTKEVDSTEQTTLAYTCTSVDFDALSRPVIAYTRLMGNQLTIQVARWNGTTWSRSEVTSGHSCTRLSLALFDRDAEAWRLAYVNPDAETLRLASAGGSNVKLADLDPSPYDASVVLSYSANSGSVAYHSPKDGLLKFGNPPDDGTNASAPFSYTTIDSAGKYLAGSMAGPGGWPHFAYIDGTDGHLKVGRRLPNFTWTSETVLHRAFADLANPTLWFDPQGNPVVACTDATGDRIRFAAKIDGRWQEDLIDRATDRMRLPFFFTSDPGTGGFRILAVTESLLSNTSHLRSHGPIDDFLDADHDGVPLRLERAFAMNANVRDRFRLPTQDIVTVAGKKHLALNLRLAPSGTSSGATYPANGLVTTVEASADLEHWVSSPAQIALYDTFTLNGVRYSTYYLTEPLGNAPRFLRARVQRE